MPNLEESMRELQSDIFEQYIRTDNKFEKEHDYDNPMNPVIQQAMMYEDNKGRTAEEYIEQEVLNQVLLRSWGENYNFNPESFLDNMLDVYPDTLDQLSKDQPELIFNYLKAKEERNDEMVGLTSQSLLENYFTPFIRRFEDDKRNYMEEYQQYKQRLIFEDYMSKMPPKNNRRDFTKWWIGKRKLWILKKKILW